MLLKPLFSAVFFTRILLLSTSVGNSFSFALPCFSCLNQIREPRRTIFSAVCLPPLAANSLRPAMRLASGTHPCTAVCELEWGGGTSAFRLRLFQAQLRCVYCRIPSVWPKQAQ